MTLLLACRSLVIGHAGRAIAPPVELEIRAGELWVVAGKNGSGKTTWVRTLLGLLSPVSGAVEPRNPPPRRCFLSQRHAFEAGYPLISRDVVAMGLERGGVFSSRSAGGTERVARSLELCDAADLAERSFHELSEGQKQRVLLARVHVSEPELAVLDEPTSAMDADSERSAWRRLKEVQTHSRAAFVVVTHSLALAAEYADRALVFERETRSISVGGAELLRARLDGPPR